MLQDSMFCHFRHQFINLAYQSCAHCTFSQKHSRVLDSPSNQNRQTCPSHHNQGTGHSLSWIDCEAGLRQVFAPGLRRYWDAKSTLLREFYCLSLKNSVAPSETKKNGKLFFYSVTWLNFALARQIEVPILYKHSFCVYSHHLLNNTEQFYSLQTNRNFFHHFTIRPSFLFIRSYYKHAECDSSSKLLLQNNLTLAVPAFQTSARPQVGSNGPHQIMAGFSP